MTDLTGAGLALATARVMGLRGVYEEDDSVWRGDGTVHGTEEWRPDLGGAAAWEVLEWVRGQDWDLDLRFVEWRYDSDAPVTEGVLCTLRATRPVRECQATGPTDAIALCRAVVALGEAG